MIKILYKLFDTPTVGEECFIRHDREYFKCNYL